MRTALRFLGMLVVLAAAVWRTHPRPSEAQLRCGQALTIVETHRMNARGYPDSLLHTHTTTLPAPCEPTDE